MVSNLKDIALEVLSDLKAKDINAMDIAHLTPITDHMIIASGTSARHIRSIANYIVKYFKPLTFNQITVEGDKGNVSDWVLVDLGDIVIHIMLPQSREYYDLDKLWSPVNPAA